MSKQTTPAFYDVDQIRDEVMLAVAMKHGRVVDYVKARIEWCLLEEKRREQSMNSLMYRHRAY